MDESVRKPLTFLAVVFVGLAVSLGYDRVKAGQTFLPDFGAGKDVQLVPEHADSQELIYKVQPGDAWWTVARDHDVSTRALLEVNGATIGTPLVTGQNLHLPPAFVPSVPREGRAPRKARAGGAAGGADGGSGRERSPEAAAPARPH